MITAEGSILESGADARPAPVFPGLTAGRRLLAVVAHPDDEAFGCGSALLVAAAAGVTTMVACATRGEAGDLAPGVTLHHAEDLGDRRERELRASCAALGVADVEVWRFADSGMTGAPPHGSLAATPLDDLTQAVRRVVIRIAPHALLTLDASDGHRDHAAVRAATERVGREQGLPTFLSCLPRTLMAWWADHMATTGGGEAYRALGELGTPDGEITHVIDASGHLARREAAIAAHGSQASPYDGLPEDLRTAFLAEVHLARVT